MSRTAITSVIFGFFLTLPFPASAVLIPPGFSEYQFIYDFTRRAEMTQPELRLFGLVQPISTKRLTPPFPFEKILATPEQMNITVFAFASEETDYAKFARARAYESLRGGFIASPISNLTLYSEFRLDERLAEDPQYTGKKWRALAGEISTAYINFEKDNWDITLGRFVSNWGPANQSLILSSTARPMDALLARLRWGRLQFSYQIGQLNCLQDPDSASPAQYRYFAGHRLDIRLRENIYLGLFETIIFGGYGRSFDIAYLNPLLFFHSVQLNNDTDDNTFLGADFEIFIRNRHKIYGQILVDDFQIDKKEPGDYEPNELGILLGFESLNLVENIDLHLEYCRITNRTYNQIFERNRYINDGRLLGHSLGPDGDRFLLTLSRWFRYDTRASVDFEYRRQGEGRFDSPWTQPWLDSPGNYDEPFPTGTVEKYLRAALGATALIEQHLFIDFNAGCRFYRNFRHISGQNETIPYFTGKLSLFFSVPISIK